MRRLPLVFVLALIACAKGGGGQPDGAPDLPPPIDMMIDGNGCATQPCSILPQCGCVGGAMACDVDTSDNMGTTCRSVNNPGKETSACNAPDKCDKGYVCLGGAAYATCKKFCMVNSDCGIPRGRCAIDISSGGMPIQGVPSACSSNCNPLPLSAPTNECPASYKCGLFTATHSGSPVKITDCTPAGAGTQGANCKAGNLGNEAMCAQGYMCTTTDAGATYICRRICNRTAGTGCTTGMCIGFSVPHTIDIEYGVCN
jgi:hypothetical protein